LSFAIFWRIIHLGRFIVKLLPFFFLVLWDVGDGEFGSWFKVIF